MVRLLKMIDIIAVALIVVVAVVWLVGCKDTNNAESSQYQQWTESLERSNAAIERSTGAILDDFKAELYRPSRREAAFFWMQNAEEIVGLSKSINQFIDSLKRSIQQKEMANSYPAKAGMAGSEILVNQNSGNRLFDSLLNFRRMLFKVDSSLERTFKTGRYYMDSFFLSGASNAQAFTSKLFSNRTNDAAIYALENIKSEVLNCEREMVAFCWGKLPVLFHGYRNILPIANQNSKRFNPSDELEINAGVGYFNADYNPVFAIDGVNVNPDENGVAVYKKNVQKKAGKYYVPVIIEYQLPDGTNSKLEKMIEYTVVE